MPAQTLMSLTWIHDLYLIGQGLADQDSGEAVLQRLLAHIVTGFEADSGSLSLVQPGGAPLRIVAGVGLPEELIGSTVCLGEQIIGWVAQHRQGVCMAGDVSSDERFQHVVRRDPLRVPSVAMCWPLLMGGDVLGVICLNRGSGMRPFTENDLANAMQIGRLISIVMENIRLHGDSRRRITELNAAYEKLEQAQTQLLQSEKMASIGQLAAGVAHEINNPVGYVNSNLGTLQGYVNDMFVMLAAYERSESLLAADPDLKQEIESLKRRLDLDFLRVDTLNLVRESQEGLTRVKKIVQDLKEFSHVDRAEWQMADLHKGLDSTLNIVHNELKYKAEVVKEYGNLPEVMCIPAQINQVFMNLLVNAAQAIEDRGSITIRTGVEGGGVFVEIADTGAGMREEVRKRLFEPFFTTKPVGKGTGLGLSLSYNIVKKHHGRIGVESAPGKGSSFRVWLPVRQETDREQTEHPYMRGIVA